MDIAMVLGGAVIALLQGMDDEGVGRVAATLHKLASRPACSPAERHIFEVIANAVDGASSRAVRRPFEVIQGAQHEQIVAIRPATERTFTLPQFFNKQPASRWLRDNNISIPGDGASHPSTTFAPSTQQIRVASTLAGWLQIDGSGTAVANTSMYLPANWVDHYSVTPGQVAAFLSTSTSTGTCSVSEVG